MTQSYRLQHLFQKYLRNDCTEPELEELVGLLNEMEDDELDAPMKALWEKSKTIKHEHKVDWEKMYQEVTASEESLVTIHQLKRRNFRRLWINTAAAASVIIALTTGGYFILRNKQAQQTAQNQIKDIAPGSNQATLTLANGQTIILNKGLSGKLAQQGHTIINVNAGNAITYTAGQTDTKVEFNTLTTKRGEQSPYPLVLADGTKVWLNAASSIRFPTAFNGKSREVSVTGEVYIEVAHNAAQPFRLINKGQTIEDIGTHFNVNAYDDEPVIKTTLLEGSVRVVTTPTGSEKAAVILKPGQQSVAGNSILKVQNANVDQVMSWRNDKFLFNDEPLDAIMRQASRWYNVDITYEDANLKEKRFGGVTARFANVSQLLNTLEMTGKVKFTIQGRKIIVQNK
ncbi:MAG TPA: FecR domain-containing protein [Mucilaginibacter sp.]|jgi:transmembrane sensor|nr:FecR domain-containing protein [Mucilaginibacter sp.]